MNTLPAKLARLLAAAVEMKAAGASWEQIADRVGRRPDTCRRWPARYPHDWRRLFRVAERQLIAEAGAESVLMLRQLLRSDDDKVRRDAARALVTLRERQRLAEEAPGEPTDDPGRVTAFLEGMNDVELCAIADELRDGPDALAGRGAPEPE
jgi:hypothetical protein